MRSEVLTISRVRRLRLVVGALLFMAGMALLAGQGLSWLQVQCCG
ncbi:Unknown protein sequence [Pseudomonas coronafaciens pv. oryzae]|nr:Unknown protein sequence [Pseudomonas coronafaciens pv. oryzae]